MSILDDLVNNCVKINDSRNYWFVRTDSGRLYESYLDQNVISIGYPEIAINYMYKRDISESALRQELLQKVSEIYPDHKVPGLIVSQLFRFFFEVKEGDVVIIPSSSSDDLAIGIVESDVVTHSNIYIKKVDSISIDDEFNKVKNINWMRTIPKNNYNPKFFQMFSSHQAIFNVNNYASWVDPLLHDFYKKNDKYYLRLNVEKENGIIFRELFSTCLSLLDVGDEILYDLSIKEDTTNIESKINLNSPGEIDLISYAPYILVLVALIIIFVNGGGLKFMINKADFDLSTGSFIDKLNALLNSSQDRKTKKVLSDKLKEQKISSPEAIINLLSVINEKNQNEQKKE